MRRRPRAETVRVAVNTYNWPLCLKMDQVIPVSLVFWITAHRQKWQRMHTWDYHPINKERYCFVPIILNYSSFHLSKASKSAPNQYQTEVVCFLSGHGHVPVPVLLFCTICSVVLQKVKPLCWSPARWFHRVPVQMRCWINKPHKYSPTVTTSVTKKEKDWWNGGRKRL